MHKEATYDYTVDHRDIDFTGRASYIAVINYLMDAAGRDADSNGFGVRDLNHDNTSWVLSRLAVEFGQRPLQGEHVSVRTWVNEVHRIGTTRCLVMTAGDGTAIASAVTQWAVIDIAERRSVDISGNKDWLDALSDEPCPVEKPKRVRVVRPENVFHRTAGYSDIDFNRHVNAVRYIAWMLDVLPLDFITGHMLARLDVNFLHESLCGDAVAIGVEDNGELLFSIMSERKGAVCMASMKWE